MIGRINETCACGAGTSVRFQKHAREWRKTHNCPVPTEEEPDHPDLDARAEHSGHRDQEIGDEYAPVPVIVAQKIGFAR